MPKTMLYIFPYTPLWGISFIRPKSEKLIRQRWDTNLFIRSALFQSAGMFYPSYNRCTRSTGGPARHHLVFGGVTLFAPKIPVCFVSPLLHIMSPHWIINIGLSSLPGSKPLKYSTLFSIPPLSPQRLEHSVSHAIGSQCLMNWTCGFGKKPQLYLIRIK